MSKDFKKKGKANTASEKIVEKIEPTEKVRVDQFQVDAHTDKGTVIPVIEEFATVTKHRVETGKVNVSKKIREYEETIDEPLFQEQVKVERVPVNQFVETSPQIRKEGQTTIIPVVEERLVIEKRLFVVEEIHVRKELFQIHEPQQITLRKEEVEVTRISGDRNRD